MPPILKTLFQKLGIIPWDQPLSPLAPTPTPDPLQKMFDAGWREVGVSPTPTSATTPMPNKTATPTPLPYFGQGSEPAYIEPRLYNALMALQANEDERTKLAELSGQESSYGYAGPHISEAEQSYGPFHINLQAGRIDPTTGQPFTQEGATDISRVVQYALDELRRTGGLGAWNPGAYDFYQNEIPERAKKKKFVRGE